MKLEIESNSSRLLGLVAKTAHIFSLCDGAAGKKCHACRYKYVKNSDVESDLGCRISDLDEAITKFEF